MQNQLTKLEPEQLQLTLPSGVEFKEKFLKIREDSTYDEWMQTGRFLSRCEESLTFWFADWIKFGREHFSPDQLSQGMANLGLEIQNLRNSLLINSLPFRDPDLGKAHHFVLARSKLDDVGLQMWSALAKKEELSAAELQESIKKGHVVHIKQEPNDGAAGVSTWQGLAMQFDLLRRQVGDKWKDWSAAEIDQVLGKMGRIITFAEELRTKRALLCHMEIRPMQASEFKK